jgi:hypothetical protein
MRVRNEMPEGSAGAGPGSKKGLGSIKKKKYSFS